MSDRDIILRTLASFRRRLRLNRALQDLMLVGGLLAVGILLWRALRVVGSVQPALTAVCILLALLLWAVLLFLLLRSRWLARTPLSLAADVADARGGLRDELKTAYWFLEHPSASPWVAAQIRRAAASAHRLDVAALLPVRIAQRTWAAAAATALLLLLAWLSPPFAPWSDAVAQADSPLSASEAAQLQTIRDLMTQVEGDAQTSERLEQALKTLERNASAQEKQRALVVAQQALEQHTLQAASTREGLYQLSERLRGKNALNEVTEALQEGDAKRAAKLLEHMESGAGGSHAEEGSAERVKNKDLEDLLKDAARADDAQHPEAAGAAAKEAVDRLNKIAEQLDVQQRVSQAAQALSQMQLAVAQRSALSAGRFGQQTGQAGTPSPDSGRTSMPGGTMYRAAAVAQENQASQQQEGSKSGAAHGESQAEEVLGKKVAPLEVQLERESIPNDDQDGEQGAAKNWFYTESKEQQSAVPAQEVEARRRFAEAQSSAPEGISLRHRQLVKDYFMNLRESSK